MAPASRGSTLDERKVMSSDADRVRSGKPVVLTDCLSGTGVDEVLDYFESRRADLLPSA